jgi:hypothetical protein
VLSVLSAAASRPTSNYATDTVELLRREFAEWDKDADDYEASGQLCEELASLSCEGSSDATCSERLAQRCKELFVATEDQRPPHPDLYRIHVRFDAIADPSLRRELQEVPTKLQLPRATVDRLIDVAGALLDESPELERLRRDLQ